jgi:hypothetical protein
MKAEKKERKKMEERSKEKQRERKKPRKKEKTQKEKPQVRAPERLRFHVATVGTEGWVWLYWPSHLT